MPVHTFPFHFIYFDFLLNAGEIMQKMVYHYLWIDLRDWHYHGIPTGCNLLHDFLLASRVCSRALATWDRLDLEETPGETYK